MYNTQQLLVELGTKCVTFILRVSYASRYEMTRSTRATYTVGVGYSRALHYSKVRSSYETYLLDSVEAVAAVALAAGAAPAAGL